MYSKILVLKFPRTEVQKPIVCDLARKFDLTFNILWATVLPRKEGVMVLELSGDRKQFRNGVAYLREAGVDVQKAEREIKRDTRRCTHCGACTAVCPTGALFVDRPEMSVGFEQSQCSLCEMCITACPTRAMWVRPINKLFFE